jgi:hypothetical protein
MKIIFRKIRQEICHVTLLLEERTTTNQKDFFLNAQTKKNKTGPYNQESKTKEKLATKQYNS